jgi:hypothetical protein
MRPNNTVSSLHSIDISLFFLKLVARSSGSKNTCQILRQILRHEQEGEGERERERETTCFEDRRVLPDVFEYKKQVMFNMTVFLTVDLVAKLD